MCVCVCVCVFCVCNLKTSQRGGLRPISAIASQNKMKVLIASSCDGTTLQSSRICPNTKLRYFVYFIKQRQCHFTSHVINTLRANSSAYSFAMSDPRLHLLMKVVPPYTASNGTGLIECAPALYNDQTHDRLIEDQREPIRCH